MAVALGAFGAHALKPRISSEMLAIYQTASYYHLAHALALLVVGVLSARAHDASLVCAGFGFLIGTVLFSGSLYALAVTEVRVLGAITPLGGVAFLVGWAALSWFGCTRV